MTDEERKEYGIVQKLPKTLAEGLECLDADGELKEKLGDDIVKKFLSLKRSEIAKMKDMSTQDTWRWEVEHF